MTVLARTPKGGAIDVARPLADDSETIDLLSLIGVLWRRKWLILLIACLGMFGGWLYGKGKVPLYTAEADVVIEPREANVINLQQVMSGLQVDPAVIATEMSIVNSRPNIVQVMNDLNLYQDPEFNVALRPQTPSLMDRFITEPFNKALTFLPQPWLEAVGLAPTDEPAPLMSETSPVIRQLATSIFSSQLSVANDGLSYVLRISFTSQDAEKAAQIANRLAEVYVQSQIDDKVMATKRASDVLEQQAAALGKEVQRASTAVADFRAKNGLLATQGVTLNDQELSSLNKELIDARADLAARQAKLDLVRKFRETGKGLDSISEIATSPVIVNLRAQEVQLVQQEADLASQYGPRHPQMIQIERNKADLEAKIRAEVNRVAAGLANDAAIAAVRVSTIQGQLNSFKGVKTEDNTAQVKLDELQREADTSQTLYQSFLERAKETKQQQTLVSPDSKIVNLASAPLTPSSVGAKLYLVAGFTLFFSLGSALALILDRLDKGVRSGREVEGLLGLPTLALLPSLSRLKRGQKPHQYLMDRPLSAYTEAIRSIYMGVRLAAVDRPTKLILVTSSLPEEGKTTLAVSLAVFAARSHKKTLLIDLDLRHPSVHRELGWQVSAGLVEYMMGDRPLDEVIQHDIETGLDFLPVKSQTTNPTDLLESQRMQDLLEICRSRYDLVIIDTAPVASVTDARLLSLMVDKVVFVLQWGKTVGSVAQESIQALHEVGANVSGAVLSRVDLAKHAQYGYGDIGQYYSRSRKYYVN
jgi:exopolysaccharide transport family protein